MELRINKIRVGKRIRATAHNVKELAANIQEVGLINPISVDSENNLLCGFRRLEACKLLGWDTIETRVFPSDVEADENLFRQEFTPEEKVKGLARIEEREKKKAEERMKAGIPAEIFPQGETRDIVAEKVGWSGRTYGNISASRGNQKHSSSNYRGSLPVTWRQGQGATELIRKLNYGGDGCYDSKPGH